MRKLGVLLVVWWIAPVIAAQDLSSCAGKTGLPLVSCVLDDKAASPDACKALRLWNAVVKTRGSGPAADVLNNLKIYCTTQQDLSIAEALRRQRRFSEALTYYGKVTAGSLPDFIAQAQAGRKLVAERSPTAVLPLPDVAQLEMSGRFEEANEWENGAASEADPHRKNLVRLVFLRNTCGSSVQRDQNESCLKSYQSLLDSLDLLRDRYLAEAIVSDLDRLKPLVRSDADRQAESLLLVAEVQMGRGQYADAVATYEKVIQSSANISPWLAKAAHVLAADARLSAAREPSYRAVWLAFASAAKKALVTVLGWLPYVVSFGAVALALWLFSLIFRIRKKKEILLTMEDRTAALPGAPANQAISEQMRREMEPRLPGEGQTLHVDSPEEMDGSSLGQLSLRVPLRALETAFQANVAFGPLTINPAQLIQQFAPLFRPRFKYEFEGAVSTSGADTVCEVVLTAGKLETGQPTRWQAVVAGDNKTQAIRDAAMKVLLAIDPETRRITGDWRSLSRLRQGMDLLQNASNDTQNRRTLWAQARDCFQEAVLEDPGNWLARFNLGGTLRKLGFNSLAAEQFGELAHSPHVPKAYIQVVKYNQAAALQKTDDEELADKAIGMLTAILDSAAPDPLLLRLAKSGKLAAIADRYARHRRRAIRWGSELPVEWMGEVEIFLAEGKALLAEIDSSVAGGGQDGAENNVVLAVIRNAAGQLEAILGRSEDARGHYRGALTLLPSFLEASLNLADLYFEKQAALDINWPTRAERLLLDVQSADPRNTRCLVLLGSLYGTTLFGRFDKAQDLLTQALPDPAAGQRLGALLFGQAKPAEAVAPLLSAVEQDRLGFSHLLLTHCTLALPVVDPRRHPLLLREKAWLLEMLDGKAGDVYEKDAENLLPAVEAALTTPPEKAADPG